MVNKIKTKRNKRKKGKNFVYNPTNEITEKPKTSKTNPFEVLSKKKFMKMGNQFNQLIDDYQSKNSINLFQDRRIGEGATHLSQDEKMKLRYKTQQLMNMKSKMSKYSLLNNENEEEENESNQRINLLTHKGIALDSYENNFNGKLDEDGNENDDEYYQQMENYMNEIEETGGKLSRKEILQNIINQSKMLKLERQKTREENKEKIEILDQNFGELTALLKKRKRAFSKFNDDYDRLASNYIYSKKTCPTERIKSDREIELEREMKIQKQNKLILKEAKKEDLEDEELNEHPDENENVKKLKKRERIEQLIADRLKRSTALEREDMIEPKNKRKMKKEDEGEGEGEGGEKDEEEDNLSDLEEFEAHEEDEKEEAEDKDDYSNESKGRDNQEKAYDYSNESQGKENQEESGGGKEDNSNESWKEDDNDEEID